MKVCFKAPRANAVMVEIENTLPALQEAVGGYIEAIPFASDVVIVCNEEGRLLNLPYNCMICGMEFYGPVLICGVNGEEFCDVPDAAARLIWRDRYVQM